MSAHTPGPWEIGGPLLGRHSAFAPVGPEGQRDGSAPAFVNRLSDEFEANARLIAAAPDLLEALEKLVETLRREAPGTPLNNSRFDALGIEANAAIAKARGGK